MDAKVIVVRVPRDLQGVFAVLCRVDGSTQSSVIRDLIEKWVNGALMWDDGRYRKALSESGFEPVKDDRVADGRSSNG